MAKFTCHSQIAPATWGNGIFNRAFPEPSKEQSTKTGANGWVFPSFPDIHLLGSRKIVLTHGFHACPNSFFIFFLLYQCQMPQWAAKALWFCQAPTKQTRNQLPTTKKNKKRLLAARNQTLRNRVLVQTLQEIPVAFRKEKSAQSCGGNPPAQRKSVCQPIFPALTAQENASKSIHSTQKRDILGPLSRVSSNTCPVQNKKASLIFKYRWQRYQHSEIPHHSYCEFTNAS